MSIPNYQTIMLPLLQYVSDNQEHRITDATEYLSKKFNLSEGELRELLPSGIPIFTSRISWAKTYLKQAGILEQPKRGVFTITDRGLTLLQEKPPLINVKLLEQYEEFRAFRSRKSHVDSEASALLQTSDETPEEQLAGAYQKLHGELESELLEIVKQSTPVFFERLVVDLLVKMGYGGSQKEAGKAIGRSGDEGIDGIINEDKLGLDVIYIQAKRWEGTVGRPEIQKFAGALMGQGAKKGVFITTSSFSKDAINYVRQIDARIILIDGDLLTGLMADHGVGVTTIGTYEIKKADMDYFE